jgi:hypothetical protein
MHDFAFFVAAWMIDVDLEQEAVELCLGQRIGALLLDRILRRDHHEIVAELVVFAVDRHRALVHGLQQRRLGFRRRAVDLVGQEQLREDRPFGEHEAVGLEIEQVGAEHVARHQIRRELDTAELQRQARGESASDQRLGRSRHAFEQNMAAGEETRQHQVDDLVLADDCLADFPADPLSDRANVLNVHQGSLPSNDECRVQAAPARLDCGSGFRRAWLLR